MTNPNHKITHDFKSAPNSLAMKKALIGFGGHAREVMAQMGTRLTCFVDDQYADENALPLSQFNPERYKVMVAIADSKDRHEVVRRLPEKTQYFTFIHPTALILGEVKIGYGSFIGAYSILTENIKIGNHSILNRGNHIGHDCTIKDFFSAMPNSVVGGNVEIGSKVYLGSCANIREKIKISDNIKIGMNSAVVNNINNPGTYVGVPCRFLRK
jgi:sugar O-acyltransferase (sialic acid O-acetyltransferase NeuD family)